MRIISITAVLFAALIMALAPRFAHAAPEAELWPYFATSDETSGLTVDHAGWQRFLDLYRDAPAAPGAPALLRYNGVTAAGKAALDGYVMMLEMQPVRNLSRDEQLAYWINLYNALTLRTVLRHYPVNSIRDIDISPGVFSNGPWGKKLVTVEGQRISLDDIEHRILRPIWRDPRLHYAINCASMGCPDLGAEAYTAENAGRLLDQAARDFVNSPRAVKIENGRLTVSSIYDWFAEDFGDGSDAAVIAHLRLYAEPELAAQLNAITRIHDDDYDWSLNDAR